MVPLNCSLGDGRGRQNGFEHWRDFVTSFWLESSMDLGHNCQPFGHSFSQGLYPGLLGNPAGPHKRGWQCRPGSWFTLRPQRAAANDDLDLRGRPRVMGRPRGEAHRPIQKRSPHQGHSSASRSSGARWSRLKRSAFCAPAAQPESPGRPSASPGRDLVGTRDVAQWQPVRSKFRAHPPAV